MTSPVDGLKHFISTTIQPSFSVVIRQCRLESIAHADLGQFTINIINFY